MFDNLRHLLYIWAAQNWFFDLIKKVEIHPKVAGGASSSSRRSAREAALQILFQENFGVTPPPHGDKANRYSLVKMDKNSDSAGFSKRLVEGVLQYRDEIDNTLKKHSEHWASERMAIVDLNVLRMAIFEMVYEKETPAVVVIDEAIEIAKKYGNENSGAFINGILDAIYHQEEGLVSKRND